MQITQQIKSFFTPKVISPSRPQVAPNRSGSATLTPQDTSSVRTGQKNNPYSSLSQTSQRVTTQKWGSGKNDSLSSMLAGQGYSTEEMYAKDANGKTLIDKVAAVNNLKNPNLIHPGQEIVIPGPKGTGRSGQQSQTSGGQERPTGPVNGGSVSDQGRPSGNVSRMKGMTQADGGGLQKREEILRGMVDQSVTPEQIRKMAVDLKNFDLPTLQKLKKSGVRIEVGNKAEFDNLDKKMQTSPAYANHRKEGAGGDKIQAAAFYDSTSKRAVFRPESLGRGIVRHELAHAVDDLAKKDPEKGFLSNLAGGVDRVFGTELRDRSRFRSEADPQLKKLFEGYKSRTNGMETENGAMFSKYGRTNSKEYVAEAYRLYYGSPTEQRKLAEADPGMFDYLKNQTIAKQA